MCKVNISLKGNMGSVLKILISNKEGKAVCFKIDDVELFDKNGKGIKVLSNDCRVYSTLESSNSKSERTASINIASKIGTGMVIYFSVKTFFLNDKSQDKKEVRYSFKLTESGVWRDFNEN